MIDLDWRELLEAIACLIAILSRLPAVVD